MDELSQTLRWTVDGAEYTLDGTPEGWTLTGSEGTVALSADGIAALARVLARVGTIEARPTAMRTKNVRAGMPWDSSEDAELRDEHAMGMSQRAIADLHDRTPGAIAARLVHLGLVEGRVRQRVAHLDG